MFINFLADESRIDEEGNVFCLTDGGEFKLPAQLAGIIKLIYNLIKIAVPILLIIFGMLDLGKAVIAQKDEEIKKGQQTFVKRLIAAAIVFFVFVIVQLVIGLVAGNGSSVWTCVSLILNGSK